MSWTATAGEKCRVLIPVHPDAQSFAPDAAVRLTAEQALSQSCAEHGLAATDIHLVWAGSCGDARHTEHATVVGELPDDMHLFVYEATAG